MRGRGTSRPRRGRDHACRASSRSARSAARDLAEADRSSAGTVGADHLPLTMSSASVGTCISSAATSSALARTLQAATAVACRSSPWHARRCAPMPILDPVGAAVHDPHAAIIDAERLGADLRDHGLEALSDRSAAGDDLDMRRRCRRWTRTPSTGPSPLFSTNMARPTPTISPARGAAARLGARARPTSTACEHLVEQAAIVAGIQHDLVAQRHQRPRIRHLVD